MARQSAMQAVRAEAAGRAAAPRAVSVEPDVLASDTIERLGHGDSDFVTALARGLAVMLALSDKRRRASIAQVSHRTGIPRAAARRSLHTLAKLGFVAVDDARRFYLRPRVLSFSHAYLSASPIAVLAQPILDRMGDSLREACSVAMLDGDEIVYLARSTSSRIMSPALNVGRRLPAYCTSIGLVLLAALPEPALDAYLSRVRINRFTDRTPRSPAALRRLLDDVRRDGFAVADQLMEIGVVSVAVPVRDLSGRVVAGMNAITQTARSTSTELLAKSLAPLRAAADELSAQLLP